MYVHNTHRQTEQPRNCCSRGSKKGWGGSRSLRAAVSLQGHLSESNLETVVVTMSVRAITMIVGRGQAATQTVVMLPGASQSWLLFWSQPSRFYHKSFSTIQHGFRFHWASMSQNLKIIPLLGGGQSFRFCFGHVWWTVRFWISLKYHFQL